MGGGYVDEHVAQVNVRKDTYILVLMVVAGKRSVIGRRRLGGLPFWGARSIFSLGEPLAQGRLSLWLTCVWLPVGPYTLWRMLVKDDWCLGQSKGWWE